MKKYKRLITLILLMAWLNINGQMIVQGPDGIVYHVPENSAGIKKMKLKVWSDHIIQVLVSSGESFSGSESLIIAGKNDAIPKWKVEDHESNVALYTQDVIARIDKRTARISFFRSDGTQLLVESQKNMEPATVMGEKCFHIKQSFTCSRGEALYGLGSYMDGEVRLNGKKVSLLQRNREDVVPFIISTNHYGLLWDNYSLSEFNDARGEFYLWSEVGDEINYFFIYGENTDQIVSSYRQLTGRVPMYPKWVFGYIQSKQKYNTQDEIVGIVRKFREKKFPLDVIVQDWQYWPDKQWGQKSFNRKNYPDPEKMVNDIHAMNCKIIISIWPNMAKGCPDNDEMGKINGLLKNGQHVNVMMPEARQLYWEQTNNSLFYYGIDGWWADCSEGYDSDWTSPFFKHPDGKLIELNSDEIKRLYGSGRYINTYALMHTKGLYEGQRSTASPKRVYILTRSAFAGMQRYGASYWTGDVSANWEEFRAQIPAGINFCMTGIPYWTTDIAGYFIKYEPGWWFSKGDYELGQQDSAFHELYTRWFQFASFCPLFRAHGWHFPREPWTFGDSASQTYKTLLKFTDLRYRLLPYIYSQAWKVTSEDYTMMRGLTFDFQNDSATFNINNQYMFGQSFMVAPVVTPLYYHPNNVKIKLNEYTRQVYLPKNTRWFDFWTGKIYDGGQTIHADASFGTMPLFVKAGSIIPMGPFVQYATERADTLEIRVYPGADAAFILYEDENDNYNYEKGIYSLITFKWADNQRKLTIDDRKGNFPGMLKNRIFQILLVTENNGTGVDVTLNPAKTIKYTGRKKEVIL